MTEKHARRMLLRAREHYERKSVAFRAACVDAHAAGLAIREIADTLGVSRMYAHRLVHGRTDR